MVKSGATVAVVPVNVPVAVELLLLLLLNAVEDTLLCPGGSNNWQMMYRCFKRTMTC